MLRRVHKRRAPIRSLRGWAIDVLMEAHAVAECPHHGHMRDRADPHAWQRAREIALDDPFPGTTPRESAEEINEVMRSIGDTCPECDAER